MANSLAGTAYVSIDGRTVPLVGQLKYRVSQGSRETLRGMDGIHGFKEVPGSGMIGGTFRDSGAISVQDLASATDVTIVAELANGKTIVGRNMWRVGDGIEVDTEEATFDIVWESADVREA